MITAATFTLPAHAATTAATIESVQAGRLRELPHAQKLWQTAIYKETLDGPVGVDRFGIVGDEHSGEHIDLDRAICIHPSAHYDFWRAYFRRDIPLGFFGENLTVGAIVDEHVCVGDVVRCGSVVLQVTQPRTPCYKQARKLGVSEFVKLILQTGRLGFLTRVIEPGFLEAGDRFELVARPHPQANLVFLNRARYAEDESEAAECAQIAALADDWRTAFSACVAKKRLVTRPV